MSYQKQQVASRLQRRYTIELIALLKELDDKMNSVLYHGLWLDIDTLVDKHYIQAKQHLNDIISSAKNLIHELDTKDIDVT